MFLARAWHRYQNSWLTDKIKPKISYQSRLKKLLLGGRLVVSFGELIEEIGGRCQSGSQSVRGALAQCFSVRALQHV